MKPFVLLLASGLFISTVALGAPFPDPTRPPAPASRGEQPTGGGTQLESILIAPDRRIAVIDGQQVTVGARIPAGEIIRITESEVVVRGTEGERALKLFPSLAAPAKSIERGTAK